MSFLRPSAAKQTTQSTGSGSLVLIANAGDTRSLQQALGSGPVKGRFMLRGQGYFEMFRGTYTAPSTLTRDEVIISSNSNTLVNIPPGTTDVYLLDYAQFLVDSFSTNKTLTNADASNSWIFTGSASATLTLPALSAAVPDFWGYVKNESTAPLTIQANGSDLNDENGLTWTVLDPGEDAWLFNGSTVWRISRNRAGAPGRNKLINGDMRIDQRLAGASVTPTGAQYLIDRWACSVSQSSKLSFQQNAGSVSPPRGATYYLGATSLSAYTPVSTDGFNLQQTIEGLNIQDLNFGSASALAVTISFWVYSSLTGTFGGALRNSGNARSCPFAFSIPVANTWTYISVTLPGDTGGTWLTTNGVGLNICFSLGCVSSQKGTPGTWTASNLISATGAVDIVATNAAKFYITNAQLEAGSFPTPFEQRDFASELTRCQRYFEKTYNSADKAGAATSPGEIAALAPLSTTAVYLKWAYKVNKRADPTVTIYSTTGASGNMRDITGATDAAAINAAGGETGCMISTTGNAGAGHLYALQATADAEL